MSEVELKRQIYLCPACNRLKPSKEFYFSKRGRITYCKECQKDYMKKRYEKERDILHALKDEV